MLTTIDGLDKPKSGRALLAAVGKDNLQPAVIDYPEVQILKNGGVKVLDTYRNLEHLLRHFDADIRYNLMSRRREISIPGMNFFSDDRDNDTLAKIECLATNNNMPARQIDKWLEVLAGENAYHPIINSLKQNPWDGVRRLDEFIRTIESQNPEQDRIIIKTFMVMAMAAVHSTGDFVSHGVLVLQGDQGIGKTAWVKKLDPINCNAVKTGVLLDPRNKDSIIGVNRFWIAELGEVDATFNKTDIAHLKSYITSPVDDVRVPWGRKETRLIRRTVFIATVNQEKFLIDLSGNRRFWTVAVKSINYQHNFDMLQVWAEVKHEWLNGHLTYLDQNAQNKLNERNREHEKVDPLEELLLTHYDWTCDVSQWLTATEILRELGQAYCTHKEIIRMGTILSRINGKKGRRSMGVTLHEVPARYSSKSVKNY